MRGLFDEFMTYLNAPFLVRVIVLMNYFTLVMEFFIETDFEEKIRYFSDLIPYASDSPQDTFSNQLNPIFI